MADKKIDNPMAEDNNKRIEEMMGPMPDGTPMSTAKVPPVLKKSDLGEAVKEFNNQLKAVMPSFDKSKPANPVIIKPAEPLGLKAFENPGEDSPVAMPLTTNSAANEIKLETEPYSNSDINLAVDEITSSETNEPLSTEDKAAVGATKNQKIKKSSAFKTRLAAIWRRLGPRRVIIFSVIFLLLATALLPWSRYFILNAFGVRASLGMTVTDSVSLQPLKNVRVSIGGTSGQTDNNGALKLHHIKLGSQNLAITKTAYASLNFKKTIGWGSNPLGELKLVPTGSIFNFNVIDFLSNKPIGKAQISSGDGDATSDSKGQAVLSLLANQASEVTVKIGAEGYREDSIKLTLDSKQIKTVKLVPLTKHVFISKKSGKYDVYSVDADGKNVKKIVSGTGLERDDIFLLPSGGGQVAAFVAARENVRNSDGFLLSTLYYLNPNSGELTRIDQSENIRLVGWTSAGRLVYVKTIAGVSAANPKRQRLISYKAKDDSKELFSANNFNDIYMTNSRVYVAPSSAFAPVESVGTFRINDDGSAITTLLKTETFNFYRTKYETLNLNFQNDWYELALNSDTPQKTTPPINKNNRSYIPSPNKLHSLWIDNINGKNILLSYETASKKDKTLFTKKGIGRPSYWLNDRDIVFRVSDGSETADYIVSIDGGTPVKISDVSASSNQASF